MLRSQTDLRARSDLDQFAEIHHADPCRDVFDYRNGMRNEKIRQAELLLEIAQQIDDLRLDRNIQCGNRLVCDDQFGFQGEGPRYPDALALATAELVRIAAEDAWIESDSLQKIGYPIVPFGSARDSVNRKGLTYNRSDRHSRVQRGVRILKDDLHIPAPPSELL